MQLHTIGKSKGRKAKKRVGRGGNRGKTSGRGMKGQGAHSSSAPRPQIRDTIKKIPKKRGYRFAGRVNTFAIVNLSAIDKHFVDGAMVTPETLVGARLIRRRGRKIPPVKILGTGVLKKKVSVSGCALSDSARKTIGSRGGTVEA